MSILHREWGGEGGTEMGHRNSKLWIFLKVAPAILIEFQWLMGTFGPNKSAQVVPSEKQPYVH